MSLMSVPPGQRLFASGAFGRLRGLRGTAAGNPAAAVATSVSVSPASASFAKGKTQQYTAQVLDQFGQDMGLTVTWSSNSGNVTINSSGMATGVSYGSATLTATYQALSNTGSATVQQPTALAVITQPAGAVSGSALTTQPVIELRDGSNNQDAESGRTVTVSIAAGSGTLSGTTSVNTDSNGRAIFTDLTITGTGSHTLTFASTGLTGVSSSSFTVSAAGSFWLANLPAGATLIGLLDMSTASLPPGNNVLTPVGSQGFNVRNGGAWAQGSGYWQVTKPPGVYGDPNNGTDWGDFYNNISPVPTKLYIAVERLHGSDDGQGYEWHPVSNKDIQCDSGGVALLSQIFEGGLTLWQAWEQLLNDYHPSNNLSNNAVVSDVKHVYEYLVEYAPTNRLRAFRDGVAVNDLAVPSGFLSAPGSFLEWYIHHFDGGGGMTRTRTTYIRYYRVALYRF